MCVLPRPSHGHFHTACLPPLVLRVSFDPEEGRKAAAPFNSPKPLAGRIEEGQIVIIDWSLPLSVSPFPSLSSPPLLSLPSISVTPIHSASVEFVKFHAQAITAWQRSSIPSRRPRHHHQCKTLPFSSRWVVPSSIVTRPLVLSETQCSPSLARSRSLSPHSSSQDKACGRWASYCFVHAASRSSLVSAATLPVGFFFNSSLIQLILRPVFAASTAKGRTLYPLPCSPRPTLAPM